MKYILFHNRNLQFVLILNKIHATNLKCKSICNGDLRTARKLEMEVFNVLQYIDNSLTRYKVKHNTSSINGIIVIIR